MKKIQREPYIEHLIDVINKLPIHSGMYIHSRAQVLILLNNCCSKKNNLEQYEKTVKRANDFIKEYFKIYHNGESSFKKE